jgi:hypothetical protein
MGTIRQANLVSPIGLNGLKQLAFDEFSSRSQLKFCKSAKLGFRLQNLQSAFCDLHNANLATSYFTPQVVTFDRLRQNNSQYRFGD